MRIVYKSIDYKMEKQPILTACRWRWGRGRAAVKAEQTTEDEDDAILSLDR